MKKFLSLILALGMVASLAACGGSSSSGDASSDCSGNLRDGYYLHPAGRSGGDASGRRVRLRDPYRHDHSGRAAKLLGRAHVDHHILAQARLVPGLGS